MPAPTNETKKRSTQSAAKILSQTCFLTIKKRGPRSRRASAKAGNLNVVSPGAWPRGTHSVQSHFLEIVVNFTRMAVEVLGDNIANLAEAGSGRNTDVFTQVVKTFEYPQTHAGIKRLQLAHPLQGLMAASGHGLGLIINPALCAGGPRRPGRDHEKKAAANDPASAHAGPILI
jgi:hypothetical protein